MLTKNFPNRKAHRQESAKVRKDQRANRSHKEQLARLDMFFGAGNGAKKERKKLNKLIG